MLPLERQNHIISLLTEKGAATVEELCNTVYASGATIRRDLTQLERDGLVKRTHGGAVLLDKGGGEAPLLLRESENRTAKVIIAQKALAMLHDGQTLFLDSSSTAGKLAERLTCFENLRVVTNSLKTLHILAANSKLTVYCTGGRLRESTLSFVGQDAVQYVKRFHADLALISCGGVSLTAGITETNEEETDVKSAFLRNAEKTVLLCDSSKLGKVCFKKICELRDISAIICDEALPEAYQQK